MQICPRKGVVLRLVDDRLVREGLVHEVSARCALLDGVAGVAGVADMDDQWRMVGGACGAEDFVDVVTDGGVIWYGGGHGEHRVLDGAHQEHATVVIERLVPGRGHDGRGVSVRGR